MIKTLVKHAFGFGLSNTLCYSSSVDLDEEMANMFQRVCAKDPDQGKFLQAFEEVALSLKPVFEKEPDYLRILEKIAEPERVIQFRVPWVDDLGNHVVNRGFRVQYNSAIGPYKGGIRFDENVDLSTLKFLGFEQTFKNALTGLPMGGGKGGSDFHPFGRSDNEVMSFCQSFTTELFRHIGADTDVPAGDLGVGGREVGFMLGQYKRLSITHDGGVFTGKGYESGGSLFRPEATGYGAVWFTEEMLKDANDTLEGKRVIVSGSGNVAQYTVENLLKFGAIPVSVSDSDRWGTLEFPNGMTEYDLDAVFDIKNNRRTTLEDFKDYGSESTVVYHPGKHVWDVEIEADIAMPSAVENEIGLEQAQILVANGVWCVCEGANMPTSNEAISYLTDHNVMFGPAKAVNCGGVSCSGLEMMQNAQRGQWKREVVEEKLHTIMVDCYELCVKTANEFGQEGNIQFGANAAGFLKVLAAMEQQGHV